MTTREVYVYDPAGTYVSPNAPTEGKTYEEYISCISTQEPQIMTVVDSSAALDYNVDGSKSGEHVNNFSTLINLEDVAWQLNHYEQFPEFGQVTIEQLKKGEPVVARKLKSSTNDSSTFIDSSEGKITYSSGVITNATTGIYYDLASGTTNDPRSINYDGDNNNVPDSKQWNIV